MGEALDFLSFLIFCLLILFVGGCLLLKIPVVIPFLDAVGYAMENFIIWLLP
jgi:hypothetical protein